MDYENTLDQLRSLAAEARFDDIAKLCTDFQNALPGEFWRLREQLPRIILNSYVLNYRRKQSDEFRLFFVETSDWKQVIESACLNGERLERAVERIQDYAVNHAKLSESKTKK
jgi:hypothetical protein